MLRSENTNMRIEKKATIVCTGGKNSPCFSLISLSKAAFACTVCLNFHRNDVCLETLGARNIPSKVPFSCRVLPASAMDRSRPQFDRWKVCFLPIFCLSITSNAMDFLRKHFQQKRGNKDEYQYGKTSKSSQTCSDFFLQYVIYIYLR